MIMEKVILLLGVIFVLLSFSSLADLEINEAMYAPSSYLGSSNEWVELYNNGNKTLNLTNCTIDDKFIEKDSLESYEYLVLARNLELFSSFYENVNAIEHSLSFRNYEDEIVLGCEDYEEILEYSQEAGAYRNNKTLERRSDSSWGESLVEFGTPGETVSQLIIHL